MSIKKNSVSGYGLSINFTLRAYPETDKTKMI
jgi:hypothetical protein